MSQLEEVIRTAEGVFLPHSPLPALVAAVEGVGEGAYQTGTTHTLSPAQVEMIVVDLLGEMAKSAVRCSSSCACCKSRADRAREALKALRNTSWRAEAPPFAGRGTHQ
jgi:hypothetical protein